MPDARAITAWDASRRFALAHEITQAYEGGVSRDPHDRAVNDVAPGEVHTYHGVRASTWRSWCTFRGLRNRPLTSATISEIRELYWTWYWLPSGAPHWPAPLGLAAFDAAVNHGTHRAVQWIQAMVGVAPDGKVGPITRDAVLERDPDHAAEHLLWMRIRLWGALAAGDPVQERNLRGWIGRGLNLRFSWTWQDRALPRDRPHLEELAQWITLRELHAQAATPRLRHRLLDGIPELVEARYRAWAGRVDPRGAGLQVPAPKLREVGVPFRPLRAMPVSRRVGAKVLAGR
jgi:hypothetical protein